MHFKAKSQGLKRRILANCGIVTENGYFTDFELIFERKKQPHVSNHTIG